MDVVELRGRIDLHSASTLRSLLRVRIEHCCPALILDFSKLTFIDSAGLATLIEGRADTAHYGGVLCVAALNPAVSPVFQLLRFDQVLPILATVADAIAAIKRGEIKAHLLRQAAA